LLRVTRLLALVAVLAGEAEGATAIRAEARSLDAHRLIRLRLKN